MGKNILGIHQGKLCGERGLIVACLVQAVRDLHTKRWHEDAERYFSGPIYRHHVTLLGLPPEWEPPGRRW